MTIQPDQLLEGHLVFAGMQGAKNWIPNVKEHFQRLQAMGTAEVTYNKPRGNVFLDINIEGNHFQAFVNEYGPYLVLRNKRSGCYLGASSIVRHADDRKPNDPAWTIVKYRNQPLVDLSGLSDAGRRAMAVVMGIPMETNGSAPASMLDKPAFYASPAFVALKQWAMKHKKQMKSFKGNLYLGDWPAAAQLNEATYQPGDEAPGAVSDAELAELLGTTSRPFLHADTHTYH